MTTLRTCLLSLFLAASCSSHLVAQLNLSEAENISAETGRTIFVIAGKKT